MEIAPGVHEVRLIGASAYLLADRELTLVDAGIRGSIRPLSRRRGPAARAAPRRASEAGARRDRRAPHPSAARRHPLVHDSDVLPALGGLRVMHLSGRMPGSPQRPRGRLTFPNAFFSDHMGLARRSIERLTGLDVDTLLLAHFPSPQLGAREALRALVP